MQNIWIFDFLNKGILVTLKDEYVKETDNSKQKSITLFLFTVKIIVFVLLTQIVKWFNFHMSE